MREVMSVLPDRVHESLMKSGERVREATGRTVSGDTYNTAALNVHKFEVMAILAEMESAAVCGERIRLKEVQLDFLSKFIVPSVFVICEKIINRHAGLGTTKDENLNQVATERVVKTLYRNMLI
jgi:hypothetical protein